VPLGKVLQDRRTVIANRCWPKALRLKSPFRALQLHELRLAEGSPIGRAEEKEDGALWPLERLAGVFMAELI